MTNEANDYAYVPKVQREFLPKPQKMNESERSAAISSMTIDAYSNLDRFGKTQEDLESLQNAMIEDLRCFPIEMIKKAFSEWRQENEKIPTTKGIRSICSRYMAASIKQSYAPPAAAHSEDITPQGQAMIDRAMTEARNALQNGIILDKPAGCVPWYGKKWRDFTGADKGALKAHIAELSDTLGIERAKGYLKYLNVNCGVPVQLSAHK